MILLVYRWTTAAARTVLRIQKTAGDAASLKFIFKEKTDSNQLTEDHIPILLTQNRQQSSAFAQDTPVCRYTSKG